MQSVSHTPSIHSAVKPFKGAVVAGGPTGSRARLRPQGEPRHKRPSPRTESAQQQEAPARYHEGHATFRDGRWECITRNLEALQKGLFSASQYFTESD